MNTVIQERLEYLRGEIMAERISAGEIVELQSLAEHIDDGDTLLLEWAGVPEEPHSAGRNMNNVNREASPPTFEERAIDLAQAMIIKACNELPELRQAAIIFDWTSGLNLGAAPFVVGNADGPLQQVSSLHDLHGMLEQTSKLVTYLGQLLQASLEHYGKLCDQMEEKLREAKQEEAEQAGPEQGEETPNRESDTPKTPFGDGSRSD
jgi:hypothetical protein